MPINGAGEEIHAIVPVENMPAIAETFDLPLNGAAEEDQAIVHTEAMQIIVEKPKLPANGTDTAEKHIIEHDTSIEGDVDHDGIENDIPASAGEYVEFITVTPDLPIAISPPERNQIIDIEKDKRLVVVVSDIVLQPAVSGKRSYTDALAEEARDRVAIDHAQKKLQLQSFAKRQMYFAKRDFRRKAEDLVYATSCGIQYTHWGGRQQIFRGETCNERSIGHDGTREK